MNITDLRTVLDMMSGKVCLSGGAKGGDRLFGLWSTENGHEQLHFSFDGHYCGTAKPFEINLSYEQLSESCIKKYLTLANRVLERTVPHVNSFVGKLLARNCWQVYSTDKVYAIGTLKSPSVMNGGTSWAIEMYKAICNERKVPCVIYLYEMNEKALYTFNNKTKRFDLCSTVPTPDGIWTGIGSRDATKEHLADFSSKFV